MADETPLEQKRAQAKLYRGVTYDSRIERFTCSIMVRGERRYLGSFLTAGEASLVYEQARENDPIERPRKGTASSIKSALIAFEESGQRGTDRKLLPGQIFTAPDGQRFRLEGLSLKNKRNRYEWTSRCRICGALFDQHSPISLRSVTGMNRTCEAHRGQLGKMEVHDWPDPAEWGEAPRILETNVVAQRGVSPIPEHWREPRKVFARKFRQEFPNATLQEIEDAHFAHAAAEAAANDLTPEEKQRARDLIAEQSRFTDARLDDVEALAEPVVDNSDLA